MSILGVSPLGTDLGPFGGVGLITVLGVVPVSTSAVVVVFDRPPKVLDSEAGDSATNARNYELTTIDPTVLPPLALVPTVPPGEVVPTRHPYPGIAARDRDDATQVLVTMDARMDPRVGHVLHVSDAIMSQGGEAFAGPQDFGFRSVGLAPGSATTPAQRAQDRYRDLARTADGGGYRYDGTRDVGISDGITSLRSRIYRRIFTSPGGFVFLPGYGVGVQLKALARQSERQQLATSVADQAQLEPDVAQATAEVTFTAGSAGGVVDITLYLRLVGGSEKRVSFVQPTSSQ